MTDPRTLAQREGPEAMEALVRDVFKDIPWIGPAGLKEAIAAARKLAEPSKVEPRWPTGKLWAWFDKQDGVFQDAEDRRADDSMYFTVPCRVVPASSVVLTREEAEAANDLLEEQPLSRPCAVVLRAALQREREAQ